MHTYTETFQGFPEVNPYVRTVKHSFVYSAGGGAGASVGPLRSVRKTDVTRTTDGSPGALVGEYTWGPAEFVSGPAFVPRPEGTSEDDGYLLVTVLDGSDPAAAPSTRLEVLLALDLCMSVCLSIYLSIYVYIYIHTHTHRCTHISIYIYIDMLQIDGLTGRSVGHNWTHR